MRRLILIAAAGSLLVAIAVAAAAVWSMCAPAIPYSKMEQMRAGMTAREVADLLGPPENKYSDGAGLEHWVCSRHTWAMYKVFFGSDGTVVRYDHDF